MHRPRNITRGIRRSGCLQTCHAEVHEKNFARTAHFKTTLSDVSPPGHGKGSRNGNQSLGSRRCPSDVPRDIRGWPTRSGSGRFVFLSALTPANQTGLSPQRHVRRPYMFPARTSHSDNTECDADGLQQYHALPHGVVTLRPAQRVTTPVGYSVPSVGGTTPQFKNRQPFGSLQYNYHQPLANLAVTLDTT